MPRPLLTRSVARAIAALCGLAPGLLAFSGLTLSDAAASVAGTRQAGVAVPVAIAITSVNPVYARPGWPVTVSGTLTNMSGNQMSGLSIQLRSSGRAFNNRGSLQEYTDGTLLGVDSPVPGTFTPLTKPLAPHATVAWRVALRGSQLPMTLYGVYPLAAEADSADQTPLAVNRTFLPFWTGQKSLGDPVRQDVAWIWPLIDQPRQAICSGLLNNGLAASFGSGGRLAGLLEAGRAYSSSALLTWAVDPALLANATTMSKPYHAGGVAGCHGSRRQPQPRAEPASQAAKAWLAGLKSATAGQQVFVTPYDDADIADLTRYNLNADLSHAFTEGRLVAGQDLGRSFSTTAGGTAAGTNGIAWPADGSANHADLANLAASDGINTVVLDSSAMPPSPELTYTPSAQTTTGDGTRSGMTVLLSDDTITQLIGSASAASNSPAQKFSIEQRYLAETAMIAAERPHVARSIVVAPPRHWDPSADLAGKLLDETVSVPWLRPVSLATLAAVERPADQVSRKAPPETVSGARLGRSLVSQVRQLDQQIQLLKSIQLTPPPGLDRGMFAIESSAWRGAHAGQQALAQQISADLAFQESRLKILVTPREQLTGKTGTVPVSISNRLNYDVLVRLQADPGGGVTVKGQPGAVRVPHGQQVIVKLQVTATAVGSTALTLSLLTPGGTPIPGARASVTIQATHYGALALVIIAAVLGAFMISSGIKTFRRRGRRARDGAVGADPAGASPGPAEDAAPAPPDASPAAHRATAGHAGWRAEPDKSDNVVSDRIRTRRATPRHADTGHASGPDPAEVEEPDDYAWAPGSTDSR